MLFIGHACLGSFLVIIMGRGRHLLRTLHLGPGNVLVGAHLVSKFLVGLSKLLYCQAAILVSLLRYDPGRLQGVLVEFGPVV